MLAEQLNTLRILDRNVNTTWNLTSPIPLSMECNTEMGQSTTDQQQIPRMFSSASNKAQVTKSGDQNDTSKLDA